VLNDADIETIELRRAARYDRERAEDEAEEKEAAAGGIPIGPDPIPTGAPDYVTGGYFEPVTP